MYASSISPDLPDFERDAYRMAGDGVSVYGILLIFPRFPRERAVRQRGEQVLAWDLFEANGCLHQAQ